MDSILPFWFPNNNFNKFWFDKSKDDVIIKKYKTILENAKIENIPKLSDNMILSYIILFDQLNRNIFRNNKSKIKKYDKFALELTEYFFENRNWYHIQVNYLIFFLMPYRHTFQINKYEKIFSILDIYYQKNKETLETDNKQKLLLKKFINQTLKKLQLCQ